MALRFGNKALDKVYFDNKRIGQIYAGSLLVYSIDMFKTLMMQRLYHTPIDGADVKKSGQVKLRKIEGNGEIVNQLITKPIDSGTVAGLTIVNNNDGSVTISGTPTAYAIGLIVQGDYTPCHTGDKLLIFGGNKICPLRSAYQLTEIDSGNGVIITAQAEREPELALQLPTLSTISNAQTIFPQCVNLTQEFGTGNEPTSLSDNRIKRIIAKGYIPKNPGTYQGMVVQRFEDHGFNIFDEQWEVGGINDDGSLNNNVSNRIRSKNFISVLSDEDYFVTCPVYGTMFWFDTNKSFITYDNGAWNNGGGAIHSPRNAYYGKFVLGDPYGTVYNHDICINLSCSRNGQYVPARWQDFYEEVEYIESTGTQWIDTGVVGGLDRSYIETKMVCKGGTDDYYILGNFNQTGQSGILLNPDDDQTIVFGYYLSGSTNPSYINLGNADETLEISTLGGKIISNSVLKGEIPSNTQKRDNSNTYLWGTSTGTPFNAYGRCYYLKMYNLSNQLVRDFIPVYRKSDKKPGLYDRANNVFYTNSGTGEFVLGPNKMLPEEYREVEYIESTAGTQYVDTLFMPTSTSKIDIDLQVTALSTGKYLFGIYRDNGAQFYLYSNSSGVIQWAWSCAYQNSAEAWDTNRHMYSMYCDSTQSYLVKDGAIIDSKAVQAQTTTDTLLLFKGTSEGEVVSYSIPYKLYSCKLYDNNVLVRSFVPCYRITDRKPGLYDKVNNKFYVNSGTGEFIAGPDVELPAGYQELEYIESTGTQYVDSGVLAKSQISANAKFSYTELTGENPIIAAGTIEGLRCYLITTNKDNQFRLGYGSFLNNSTTVAQAGVIYTCIATTNTTPQTLTINGAQVVSTNYLSSFVSNITLPILAFKFDAEYTYFAKAKLYSLKLYDNNTLVRSFIPARRLADNEIGLYDKVNSKFYSNKGSGSFIAGPEVNVRTSFMLPQPLKLDGAMNAHDTFEVLDDVYRFTRNVWKVDLSTCSYTYDSQYTRFRTTNFANTIKTPETESAVANALCSGYIVGSDLQYWNGQTNKTCFVTTGASVYFVNHSYTDVATFKIAMSGVPLYYQLATPQVISIPKKHLGYVKLKDLSWGYASGLFYSRSLRNIAKKATSASVVANAFILAYLNTSRTGVDSLDKSLCIDNDGDVDIHDSRYSTVADLVASFSDTDVLFYETQDEVSDPLLSLPFQKGGELNGQQYELPVEYQKVEYIESTGTQWIDSGFMPGENTRTIAKLYTDQVANKNWFGSTGSVSEGNSYVFNSINQNVIEYFFGNSNWTNSDTVDEVVGKQFVVDFSKKGIYINNTLVSAMSYTSFGTPTLTMCIFVRNGGTANISGRVYYLQIYDNNTLARNFIPCYRKSDGTIGLYDKVTNQFFTNQGTGTFLKGPDVNQIIDCEVLPNVEVKAQKA